MTTTTTDTTTPAAVDVDALLAFHRSHFGDARMEDSATTSTDSTGTDTATTTATTTETATTEPTAGTTPDAPATTPTTAQEPPAAPEAPEVDDNALTGLPADRLAAMLKDKRKAEAGLRTKLRESESERDALRATVSGFQRQALLEVAKGKGLLDTARDDLTGALQLGDVLDEAGLLDAGKAAQAITELSRTKPHWFRQISGSAVDHAGGSGEASVASWHDVIGSGR